MQKINCYSDQKCSLTVIVTRKALESTNLSFNIEFNRSTTGGQMKCILTYVYDVFIKWLDLQFNERNTILSNGTFLRFKKVLVLPLQNSPARDYWHTMYPASCPGAANRITFNRNHRRRDEEKNREILYSLNYVGTFLGVP